MLRQLLWRCKLNGMLHCNWQMKSCLFLPTFLFFCSILQHYLCVHCLPRFWWREVVCIKDNAVGLWRWSVMARSLCLSIIIIILSALSGDWNDSMFKQRSTFMKSFPAQDATDVTMLRVTVLWRVNALPALNRTCFWYSFQFVQIFMPSSLSQVALHAVPRLSVRPMMSATKQFVILDLS